MWKQQKLTDDIEDIAVTILVMNNESASGWKYKPENKTKFAGTTMLKSYCNDYMNETIDYCIKRNTYEDTDIIKNAYLGYPKYKETVMDSTYWIEDFTTTFNGRYYTLNIPRTRRGKPR